MPTNMYTDRRLPSVLF